MALHPAKNQDWKDFCGNVEDWWPNGGECSAQGVKFYYSDNNSPSHRDGVSIIVTEPLGKCVTNFIPLSDRAMILKINTKPVELNVIQIYAPTTEKDDDEIEGFYCEIESLLKLKKPHEMTIIMGDFNAKIGTGRVNDIVCSFGLGTRNERDNRLIEFCEEFKFKVTNTWFRLPPRRLYTWKSPQDNAGNIVRNQIDFIFVNKRFATSIMKVSTYPGADVPSDHNLLQANVKSN
ncbi:craniofacial development protein 2-like [Condylostylus longicornis]|uniref:craniofacial development protein 2-like n=1 Tax=Condylostylus longicornis TaxID=2530218 RepID=UPI00244E02D3|nr:craniofacial development protein 2-like [Condylostylus longicornis]